MGEKTPNARSTRSTSQKPSGAVSPSASARIRDNQRRSRARRKEYVRELEERLRNYERLGVVATQEVQAVGRRLLEENRWLRSLLDLHGVPVAEIDRYLQSRRDEATSDTPEGRDRVFSSATKSREPAIVPEGDLASRRNASTLGPAGVRRVNNARLSAGVDKSTQTSSSSPVECQPLNQSVRETRAADLRTASSISDSPGPDELGRSMSCEAAASIIAGMREFPDSFAIRDRLGCVASSDCRVTNMTVFEMLDV